MSGPAREDELPGGSRQLYADWLSWVESNLGRNADRSSRSATAAVEVIRSGGGYNAAARAAEAAWTVSPPSSSAESGADRVSRVVDDFEGIERFANEALTLATLALILGLVVPLLGWAALGPLGWFFLAILTTVPAIVSAICAFVLGTITLRRIHRSRAGQGDGNSGTIFGKALAAMIIGVLLLTIYGVIAITAVNTPPQSCYIPDFGMVC